MTTLPKEVYDTVYAAYDHFNTELFESRLPDAMLVLHRKKNARGYFWAEQWTAREGSAKLDEIALNPESMGRTAREVLSTLAHEMVHLEQQHFGKPGKGGHHNKEWGTLMDRIGLTPTATGVPGGKRTGRKVTHYIVPTGDFAKSCERFGEAPGLAWFVRQAGAGAKASKRDASKVKKTCPCCAANVWGKQGYPVICGICEEPMSEEGGDL